MSAEYVQAAPIDYKPDSLHIGSNDSPEGRPLTISGTVELLDGKKVNHGLAVHFYPDGVVKAKEEWILGTLVRQTYFYPNGVRYRYQNISTGDDGFEEIYSSEGKSVLAGIVKKGKRWKGDFLVLEQIPGTYGQTRLMVYRYALGISTLKSPFDPVILKLPLGVSIDTLPQRVLRGDTGIDWPQ